MSDYQDFCEAFGGDANDPDFMDTWLDKYTRENVLPAILIQKNDELKLQSEYGLSKKELSQVIEYVSIFKKYSFKKHYEVNNYISKHNLWDNFSTMRSLNDHGTNKNIPGIMPKFFSVICRILEISGGNGAPLDKAKP